MKPTSHPMALLIFLILTITAAGALAQHSYVEDFTTNTYEWPAAYNPDWNTAAGELRLYPFTPSLEGVADTPGNSARKIARAGRYAFVADGFAGIQVIDLSTPEAPIVAGSFNTPGYAYQVHIDGNQAYVADHSGGLRVLDITSPTAPVEVAFLTLPDLAIGVFVAGNYAYVGAGGAGVVVVDISNPAAPSIAGIHDTAGNAVRSIWVEGNYAYAVDGNNGLVVLDISNPTGPYPAAGHIGSGYARDLDVRGDYAYITRDGVGLDIVDISNPMSPVLVGNFSSTGVTAGIHVEGARAFLTHDQAGLQVIDISNPVVPVLTEVVGTPGTAYDVVVDGEYAFVADFGPGLQAIRIAQRTTPLLRGRGGDYSMSGNPVVSGQYAYVPVGNPGLEIMDISDPEAPTVVAVFDPASVVMGVDVSGNIACLAVDDGGLMMVDVTDPAVPFLISQFDTVLPAWDVAISGDYAFVTNSNGVQVVDISDPAALLLAGSVGSTFASQYFAKNIAIEGNLAFVHIEYGYDLDIINISNPALPSVVGSFYSPTQINGIAVHGNQVYIAGGSTPLLVVDITDPSLPVQIGSRTGTDISQDVAIMGEHVYVAVSNRILIYDISNPYSPGYVVPSDDLGVTYQYLIPQGEMLLGARGGGTDLDMLQVYQHEVDLSRNQAASTEIDTGPDTIVRVRVNSQHTDSVLWDMYINGNSAAYRAIENTWYEASYPGPGLFWRADLRFAPGTLSATSSLEIEWLYDIPLIESVVDIPNDQGRQVRLEWTRSGHDFVGDATQITQYAIYRQIDGGLTGKALAITNLTGASASLQQNALAMKAAGWDFLSTVPVLVEDRYAVVVPTLADSTAGAGVYHSTFKVVALTATPGVFFTSHPDSGSSIDNLAPGVPLAITAAYGPTAVDLTWDEAPETDFQMFRVYRSTDPNFVPSNGNLVREVAVPAWTDATTSPWQYHYKISAVDFSGNESLAGEVLNVSDTPLAGPAFVLHGAVPNPFNPSTRINYSLAESGRVELVIYDVSGRLVRTLIDDVLPAGDHHVRWDGRNQAGQTVASGAYFSLLRSGKNVQRQRMMLMK